MVVKNLGISILMFIFLVGFAFSIDVMRGLEVKEALKNMMSTFRVLERGELIVYIVIFMFLLGNVLFDIYRSKQEKKQPLQKESSK